MALLIDGYNLLHATDIVGTAVGGETALHASREALLRFLAAALDPQTRAQTTIVFDAAGAPPGLPRSIAHEGMTAHFARRYDSADEMLEDLIEAHPAPKSLLVVSGDHRVQRAARRRGAEYIDSERWFNQLKSARRIANSPVPNSGKPADVSSPEQVAYWVQEFTDAAQLGGAEPSEELFPPGYGEDLLESLE